MKRIWEIPVYSNIHAISVWVTLPLGMVGALLWKREKIQKRFDLIEKPANQRMHQTPDGDGDLSSWPEKEE